MAATQWTDELRAEVVAEYEAANPTAENTMEIVAQIAESRDLSVNGVRMALSKAGVYINKETGSASSAPKAKKEGTSTRVSKDDAINALRTTLEDKGLDVDEEIITKLTGKAAVYFNTLIAGM